MSAREVGKLLREFREARGLSQGSVAELVGCGVSYVSDLERGMRACTPLRLGQFAAQLNLSEGETIRLFVARGELPPLVRNRLLQSPEHWTTNFRTLSKPREREPLY